MAHVRDSRTVIIVLTPESIKFVDSNQAITEYANMLIYPLGPRSAVS